MLWKQRNKKNWNGITDPQSFVFERAKSMLYEWKAMRKAHQPTTTKSPSTGNVKWLKPNAGRFKCNIDMSFSTQYNEVGICIRDDTDAFVPAKIEWCNPICNVHIDEALECLSALKWVHELNLGSVNFELDSKSVLDKFSSNKM